MPPLPPLVTVTLQRVLRVLRFDLDLLDDVQHDRDATIPALLVAGGATVLLALGGWLWWLGSGLGNADSIFWKSVVLGTLLSMAMWLVWLLVVYAVLHRLNGGQVAVDRLMRAAGFATAPLALGVLMAIPVLSFAIGLIVIAVWVVTMQQAVTVTSGAEPRHAAIANLAGFAVWAIAMTLLASAGDPLAPGPFLADAVWDAVSG